MKQRTSDRLMGLLMWTVVLILFACLVGGFLAVVVGTIMTLEGR